MSTNPNPSPRKFKWYRWLILPGLLIFLSVLPASFFINSIDRHIKTELALNQVNGGAVEFVTAEAYSRLSNAVGIIFFIVVPAFVIGVTVRNIKKQ